jgi:transglutaminase-like putative cysteine protease
VSRALATATLLLLVRPAARAAEPEPEPRQVVLHAFETVDRARRPLGNGRGLSIALELNPDRARLPSELVRRTGRKVGPDAVLTVAAAPYAPSRDRVRPEHRRASFVLDYDEPAFAPLRAALREAYGARPTLAQLVAFTDRHIAKKNLSRGFDIASVVARRGEGDCTEHAVLLAALARASGYPARVVTGLALVQMDDGPQAFGHAWAELYVSGRWTLADAALTAPPTPLYLPLSVLTYEGMGLAPGLAPELGILDVRRVVVQAD